MIRSMTGFGRGEARDDARQFIVEMKSVNHRYNDIVVRMPKRLSYLEEKVKDLIKDEIKRGRVELYISLEDIGEGNTDISLNSPLAEKYLTCLKGLRDQFQVTDDISVSLLARFPDIIKIETAEEDEDQLWLCLKEASQKALQCLMDMRRDEGKKLAEDIGNRCTYISGIIEIIEKRAPQVVLEYKEKLRERVNELLEDSAQIDETRLSTEVVIYADKSSITEEIVRLNSHIYQLRKTLTEKQAVGRKLDFLIQEMNREVNTIGSKSNDLEIVNHVVELKSELEKIREQVQNIE
ncbi:YicC/YloC family endoribonuclease [Geosporobacter ferrireducens]|uniref:YicC family protein n=1 Tax=Geosporobacter ferrireducens TaxID=1424294 RepID=A0A1D8GBZ5_9FIRM|nr:YicC/YloC family endoribonuclease [Geosporobacter ferrireducens]AOT68423.1 YicC family protein [Geosporobacter ferrireducens]MTI53878.1 YicC family protein [Geosporobacter ferrireducens]